MEELIAFLGKYHEMTPGLIEHLRKIIKFRKVKKWEFLLQPPETSNEIYFVAKGLFRGYYLKKDGTEVSAWFMGEGKLICSIPSFYEHIPSFEFICALEDAEVFYITFDELQAVYDTYMEFNYIGRTLITEYLISWAWQLYNIRMMSALERYEWLLTNVPDVVERVLNKYVASFLDITEYTLSRVRHEHAEKKKGDGK